jgi:L-amino acid N-acyltransferase YncA
VAARTAVIRPAAGADVPALTAIYNEGIAGRQATFETRPREPAEVAGWLEEGLPLIVAEDAERAVIGFAKLSAYSDRCVYSGVGEHGVYVAAAARGHGVGRALLEALCEAAERAGYYKLTARIFTTNAASLAVHRAAGFDEVGVQRRHGRLDGEWRDCVLVERLLGDATIVV